MEKEILIQFLIFYQTVSGQPVFYNYKENEFLIKDNAGYKNLFDKKGLILDISPSLLIPIEKIKNENITIPEKIISIGSQIVGKDFAKSAQKAGGMCAINEQNANENQELIKKFAGKKPIIIMPFAHLSESPDMQKLCLELEKLFIQTLKPVNDSRAILKIKNLYDSVLTYQKKNDLFKVAQMLEKMIQKRAGQKNIIQTRQKEIKNKRRKKIIKLSLLITSIVLILFTVLTIHPPHRDSQNYNYDSLLIVYQIQNNVKFWKWRNDTILNSLQTKSFNSENEILNEIKKINSEL